MNDSNNLTDQSLQLMSVDDHNLIKKVVTFREKVAYAKNNPVYKSGGTMTPEEAVWNLKVLFNATYGFPDEQYGRTKTDSALLHLPIDANGEILLDDVIMQYDEIINLVTQFYYNSGYENKGFLLLDLTQGEVDNGQIEIGLRAVTGEKKMDGNRLDRMITGGTVNGEADATEIINQVQMRPRN